MSNLGNFVQCRFVTPLAIGATEMTLYAADAPYNLPPAGGGLLVLCDSPGNPSFIEVISYTSRTGLNLSGVVRGLEGTTARAWSGFAYCFQSMLAGDYAADMNAKENAITAGTASQMWLGNKTWASVLSQVQGTLLTGLSLATGTAITAADTVLGALGKIQGQLNGKQPTHANLAALSGLTGAADKLPYFTGAGALSLTTLTSLARTLLDDTTPLGMQSTLGLVKQTSTTDTTAGALMLNGAHGLGGTAIQNSNFNTVTVAGRYYNATPSDTGLPNADYWELEHLTSYQPSVFSQRAVGVGGGNLGQTYTRGTTSGAAGLTPWVRVVREGDFGLGDAVIMGSTDLNAYPKASGFYFAQLPTGNAPPGVTSNYAYVTQNAAAGSEVTQTWVTAALTTQMFFRRTVNDIWGEWVETYTTGNILGTVSQSGGVPTGAIIERGSNANGEYVRWADGTQICTLDGISFTAGGGMTNVSGLYPAPFLNTPSVLMGDGQPVTHEDVYGFSRIYSASNQSQWSVGYRNGSSGSQTIAAASMFAIGRWY